MDRCIKAITADSRIRLTVADVTMTAKALEARHLSGPVAAAVLGEALAAVALLSADASSADEAWMLRMNVNGPIAGVLVEGTGEGRLRGFTNQKTLGALDGVLPIETSAALGESGSVQVVSSLPGRITSQAVLNVSPPQMRYVLGRYYNQSMQVPSGCNAWVVADDGGLLSARSLLIQRMEDSNQETFITALACLEQGKLDPFMRARVWPQDIASSIAEALSLDTIQVREERQISFSCRCDKGKVLGILQALSKEEIDKLIADGASQDVTCHMCGQTYTASTDDLRAVRAQQAGAAS